MSAIAPISLAPGLQRGADGKLEISPVFAPGLLAHLKNLHPNKHPMIVDDTAVFLDRLRAARFLEQQKPGVFFGLREIPEQKFMVKPDEGLFVGEVEDVRQYWQTIEITLEGRACFNSINAYDPSFVIADEFHPLLLATMADVNSAFVNDKMFKHIARFQAEGWEEEAASRGFLKSEFKGKDEDAVPVESIIAHLRERGEDEAFIAQVPEIRSGTPPEKLWQFKDTMVYELTVPGAERLTQKIKFERTRYPLEEQADRFELATSIRPAADQGLVQKITMFKFPGGTWLIDSNEFYHKFERSGPRSREKHADPPRNRIQDLKLLQAV